MTSKEPQIDGLELTEEEMPYKDDVHLDAGKYDGLKRVAFIEGYQAAVKKALPIIRAKEWQLLQEELTTLDGLHEQALQALQIELALLSKDWTATLTAEIQAERAKVAGEIFKGLEDNVLWIDSAGRSMGLAPSGNRAHDNYQSLKARYTDGVE